MLTRALGKARYLILIAVIGSFLASTTLLVYGLVEVVQLIAGLLGGTAPIKAKVLVVACIETIDLFLLGTVLLLIALGLYELFIDDGLDLPEWLEIRHLDDLKNKLTSVVIVVLAVLFLGQTASWDGERDLLPYGAAIALVIGALTWFLREQPKKKGGPARGSGS